MSDETAIIDGASAAPPAPAIDVGQLKACTADWHVGPSMLPRSVVYFARNGKRNKRGKRALDCFCRNCRKIANKRRASEARQKIHQVLAASPATLIGRGTSMSDVVQSYMSEFSGRNGMPALLRLAKESKKILRNGTNSQKLRIIEHIVKCVEVSERMQQDFDTDNTSSQALYEQMKIMIPQLIAADPEFAEQCRIGLAAQMPTIDAPQTIASESHDDDSVEVIEVEPDSEPNTEAEPGE